MAGSRRLDLDPASRKSQQLPNKHQINQWQKYPTTSGNDCCLCREYFIGSNLSKGIRCVYSLAIMALMPDHLTLWMTHIPPLRPTLVISQSINPIVNSCWHPAPAQTGGMNTLSHHTWLFTHKHCSKVFNKAEEERGA